MENIAGSKKLTYTETPERLSENKNIREADRGGEFLGKFRGEFIKRWKLRMLLNWSKLKKKNLDKERGKEKDW